jgi:hypothetical protein
MIAALVSAARRFTGPMGCGADAPLENTAVVVLQAFSDVPAARGALVSFGGARDGGGAAAFLLEFATRRRLDVRANHAAETCLHIVTFSALCNLCEESPAICERARRNPAAIAAAAALAAAAPFKDETPLDAAAAWAAEFVAWCCNPTSAMGLHPSAAVAAAGPPAPAALDALPQVVPAVARLMASKRDGTPTIACKVLSILLACPAVSEMVAGMTLASPGAAHAWEARCRRGGDGCPLHAAA